MSAGPLTAAARAALRRVLLAVHPDKVSALGAAARDTNTRSLAQLNSHVDALESGRVWGLREQRLRFVIAASTASVDAVRVACVLPASGDLRPLFTAFAPYVGGVLNAPTGSGGPEAAAAAEEAEARTHRVHDVVSWLRNNAAAAGAALARREALRAALNALCAEHGLCVVVTHAAEHHRDACAAAAAEHVHALSAALRAAPAAAAALRDLHVVLVSDDDSRLLDGGDTFCAAASGGSAQDADGTAHSVARLAVAHDGWLYLSLRRDAAAYARCLEAHLEQLRAAAARAAAEAATRDADDAITQRVASALGVSHVYSRSCSFALSAVEHAAFCARVLDAASAAGERLRPHEPPLHLYVRVERDVARADGVVSAGGVAWRTATSVGDEGPLLAWCMPGTDSVVVAADCPPHELARFLSAHGAELEAAHDRVLEPLRRLIRACNAAGDALGGAAVSTSLELPHDAAMSALARLTAAAPRRAPLLHAALGRLAQRAMVIIVADDDPDAWAVSPGGNFSVPASFTAEDVERALARIAAGGASARAPEEPAMDG